MKHLYRISLFLNVICLGYFIILGAQQLYQKNQIPDITHSKVQPPQVTNEIMVLDAPAEDTQDLLPVSAGSGAITTADTEYIIKEYDFDTKKTDEYSDSIPEQYIGKTREQLEDIIKSYNAAPALKDLEKGFMSMELSSFSALKIVIIKNYYSQTGNTNFYLMVEDSYITVFHSDLKTVYLYTDILLTDLPDDLQQEILDKKYIETEEELYNFLESYSS